MVPGLLVHGALDRRAALVGLDVALRVLRRRLVVVVAEAPAAALVVRGRATGLVAVEEAEQVDQRGAGSGRQRALQRRGRQVVVGHGDGEAAVLDRLPGLQVDLGADRHVEQVERRLVVASAGADGRAAEQPVVGGPAREGVTGLVDAAGAHDRRAGGELRRRCCSRRRAG